MTSPPDKGDLGGWGLGVGFSALQRSLARDSCTGSMAGLMCRIYGQDNCSCVICTSAFHGGRMPILHRYLDVTLLGSLIDIRSARHLDFRSITCRSHCRGAKIGYVQDVRYADFAGAKIGKVPLLEWVCVPVEWVCVPDSRPIVYSSPPQVPTSLPPCLYLCSSVLTQALLFWLFARCQRPSDNALFPSSVRSLLPDYPIVLRSGCHRLG